MNKDRALLVWLFVPLSHPGDFVSRTLSRGGGVQEERVVSVHGGGWSFLQCRSRPSCIILDPGVTIGAWYMHMLANWGIIKLSAIALLAK